MSQNEFTISEDSRSVVAKRLRSALPGKNLFDLATQHSVTIFKDGRLNKGWVGQTVERVAELSAGNSQKRDGADFELKTTSLVPSSSGWKPKETIRITQLSPSDLIREEFEASALWEKLSSLIFVGCYHDSPTSCRVISVSTIDLIDADLVEEIRAFWGEVKLSLCLGEFPDLPNLGSYGKYIQLRGTGDGKSWSTCPVTGRRFPSRAFYGTKKLIQRILEVS
jgi:DNA mismatch repair protein MutH